MTRFLNQNQILPQATMDTVAVGIVGTGAIGSFVAMALTKMGFKNIVTWDFDRIEDHNIANQMFPVTAVGKKKAIATREMVKQFSGEDIICLATKAAGGHKVYDYLRRAFVVSRYIVILAVDSLDVRKSIVEGLGGYYDLDVIDARMGAKTYRVMGFSASRSDQVQEYLNTLVPDAEAVQERCGQKSIIYTVLGVAAEVCSFVNHMLVWPATDGSLPRIPKPVVFDYGTGMRLQERPVGVVESLDDLPDTPEQPAPLPIDPVDGEPMPTGTAAEAEALTQAEARAVAQGVVI